MTVKEIRKLIGNDGLDFACEVADAVPAKFILSQKDWQDCCLYAINAALIHYGKAPLTSLDGRTAKAIFL